MASRQAGGCTVSLVSKKMNKEVESEQLDILIAIEHRCGSHVVIIFAVIIFIELSFTYNTVLALGAQRSDLIHYIL